MALHLKSTGIDFVDFSSNVPATSELLDDYEEGTWTGTANSIGGGSLAVTTEIYSKIGNMAYIFGALDANSLNTTAGSSFVSGLPFTAGQAGTGAATKGDNLQGGTVHMNASSTNMYLSTFSNISGQIRFSIWYKV